ncbi:peptidylprolyl isomerase [soil metagenome]
MNSAGLKRRSVFGVAVLWLAKATIASAQAPKPRVKITTDRGSFVVELEAAKAPITSANFLKYVDAAKYDGGTFYRASRRPGAPQEGVIVGGMSVKAHPFPPITHESTETTGLRHVTGTISLGRFAPGTATADFFICASPQPYLDAHPKEKGDNLGFAAFGQVVQGMGTVRRILALPTKAKSPFPEQKGQWLTKPVSILSMKRL